MLDIKNGGVDDFDLKLDFSPLDFFPLDFFQMDFFRWVFSAFTALLSDRVCVLPLQTNETFYKVQIFSDVCISSFLLKSDSAK